MPHMLATGKPAAGDWLISGGETGGLIGSMDWSKTPLGPRERWPQSLRTAINMILSSCFPCAILWGSELILIYNESYRIIAGGRHPEAMGRSARDVWPEAWHTNQPIFEKVMMRGEAVHLQDQHLPINRQGHLEEASFTLCYSPIWTEDGKVGGTLVMLMETMQRVVSEERLRQGEAELNEAQRLAHVGSWTWRAETDTVTWSQELYRIFGRDPRLPPPNYKEHPQIYTPESFAQLKAAVEQALQTGAPYELDLELVRPDGRRRWITSRGETQRDAQDRILGLRGTVQDITERKHTELALREQAARAEAEAARADRAVKALAESEQRYRYMGETIPFGVWWCNPKGEAEYTSPSFLALLNMSMEEMRQFGWTQRLVPEDVEPMMSKWLHCCATGTPWDHEHRIIDRHGKVNTVLSRGLPVRDEAGHIIAWVGVNLDITDRKQIELQLNEAKEALEQALHVKDQFLANISHELRTPLTLILGPVRKLLAASNLTEEQRRELAVVERNGRTLLKIVNDLLDLSKLDAGRMGIDYVQTDLVRLARYVASHFEVVADEKQIRFAVEMPDALPAQVDPGKVQRVLFNLLSNAFKFTPAQGAVRFSLGLEDGRALFAVEDTGPGIPPEMGQAIFERFRQVEGGPTRRHGGTGLGLAIVREFVSLHQGSVAVTQASGGGARFTVEIPRTAPDDMEVKAAEPTLDEEAGRASIAELRTPVGLSAHVEGPVAPDAPLVLVVEDHPEMNAFVAESLGMRYRVATAFDGQEGLEKATELRPDLIVSDLMMPRMSGEDLVREARQHPELDEVPILLLTAKADENLRVKLLSTGAQDCLTKPFVTEELVARAAGLIDRKRKAEAERREREERYRTLFNSIDEGFCIIEMRIEPNEPLDYRFIEVNQAFKAQSTLANVTGKWMRELRPEHEESWFEIYRDVALTGKSVRFEHGGRALEDRWFSLYAFRIGLPEQRRVAILFNDITERKRAEAERERLLKEADVQRARLQAILDSLPVGVWIADATGKMVTVNEVAREIWGGQAPHAENVAGYQDYRAWWADTGELITAEEMPLARAIRGETMTGAIVNIERFDGTRGTQLISAAPVQDREGKTIGGITIVQDITHLKQTEEALRQALAVAEEGRQTLHAMMEHIPMGITIADAPDVTIRAISRYGRELTGKPRDQLEGIPVDRHAERWQIYRADGITPAENEELPLTRATQQGEFVREEEWVLGRGDGTRIPILCTAAPIRNAQDHITGGVIGWQDITERKRAEAALRESEERLRLAAEGVDLGIWDLDLRTNVAARTLRHDQIFGYQELQPVWTLEIALKHVLPEDRPIAIEAHAQAEKTGKLFHEVRVRWPDGSTHWISARGQMRYDAQGQPLRIAGVVMDVTERKRAEDALRRSEARWNAAIESFAEGAIIATEDEQVIYWNPAAREMHGFSHPDEFIEPLEKTPITFQLWTPDGGRMLELDEWPMRRIKRGETVRNLELRIHRPDQGWVKVFSYSGTMVDTAGGERLIFLTCHDLTELRRAQEELRRWKDELEVRVEQRTTELAAANRDLEAFSYSVSHDLRAPLRHVASFVQLLDQHAGANLDEKGRRYLKVISEAAGRMGHLIDDLLALSRIGRATLEQRAVNLRRLVDEARGELAPETAGRAIEWRIGPLPQVQGDPTLLRNALVNLLSNAIKYTRPRDPAVIEVGCEEGDGEFRCFVRDNGVGFDMRFADKLFGVFQRLHRAEEFEGTGIGLASVRRIIQKHGGRTWAEGAVDQGATFFFSLPGKRGG